jgi:hypothetical protein
MFSIRFSSGTTAQSYGKLVDLDDLTDEEQACAKSVTMPLVPGLNVLRCQSGISSLLVLCCELILHDMTEEQRSHSSIQTEPSFAELIPRADAGHSAFPDYILMAPYRQRRLIDFERLRGYVDSTFDITKDHLWALREDPSYISDHSMEFIKYRDEMLPDEDGNVHYCVDTPGFLDLALKSIIVEAYTLPGLWHAFSQRLLVIRKLIESESTVEKQIEQMSDFRASSKRLRESLIGRVKKLWIPSSNTRERYIRLYSTADESAISG